MGQHNVRVDDSLWYAAMAKARTEGKTVTDVITETLRSYTGAVTVAGITIQPDVRMPPGIAAMTSDGQEPVIFALPAPAAAAAPIPAPASSAAGAGSARLPSCPAAPCPADGAWR
jgi:hypothetical protein